MTWAVLWRSENNRNGKSRYLIRRNRIPVLFVTRQQARDWIEEHYGYIRNDPSLRVEPHGWQMPIPTKIRFTVEDSR